MLVQAFTSPLLTLTFFGLGVFFLSFVFCVHCFSPTLGLPRKHIFFRGICKEIDKREREINITKTKDFRAFFSTFYGQRLVVEGHAWLGINEISIIRMELSKHFKHYWLNKK